MLGRKVLPNLLLASVSVAIVLLALEIAARLARGNRLPGKEAGTIALYTEHDPLLGWRKKPGARARFNRPEYAVEVAINSHGLRDREREYQTVPGTFRVLALGDSFVEAYTVPLEATASSVLERLLQTGGCATEVINGGTAAYSTDQEYLFYKTEGFRYSPRVVVLFFYFNDVLFNGRDNYFGDQKPLFGVDKGELIDATTPIPPKPPAPPRAAPVAPPAPEGSALVSWVAGRLQGGAPRAYSALAFTGLWKPLRVLDPPLQLKTYKRRRIEEIETGWERTDAILGSLARAVAANGAHLLVAYVPSRMEVNDADWELSRIRYGMEDGMWDRGLVLQRLREIAARRTVPVLDLTPSLVADDHGLLGGPYFRQDGHWNERGNEIAAREVAKSLTERGWVSKCETAK